ncbi:MAG TPA: fused MFS/spermidine synthase, partial [Nitrospirota bacterium]|nr:fused MFS/spermidine synthase [Nitrospirota bacterium]
LLLVLEYRGSRVLPIVGWAAALAVIIASGYYLTAYGKEVRVMARNFYGGLRVTQYNTGTKDEVRTLVHGSVTHGVQYTAPHRRRTPISYYGQGSGVSLAAKYLRRSTLRVGVIGLGAGSLAAYARHGDIFRFYEINPLVEQMARSEFTYLADCPGKVDVVLGDGRLSLEREPDRRYDLLVIDAFSGDAIPVHLLTEQALELYFRRLDPDGILALHITNSHLDIEPVVAKLASALGKQALLVETDGDEERKIYRSQWALLSTRPVNDPEILGKARALKDRPGLRLWTDDYNNLFQILK